MDTLHDSFPTKNLMSFQTALHMTKSNNAKQKNQDVRMTQEHHKKIPQSRRPTKGMEWACGLFKDLSFFKLFNFVIPKLDVSIALRYSEFSCSSCFQL